MNDRPTNSALLLDRVPIYPATSQYLFWKYCRHHRLPKFYVGAEITGCFLSASRCHLQLLRRSRTLSTCSSLQKCYPDLSGTRMGPDRASNSRYPLTVLIPQWAESGEYSKARGHAEYQDQWLGRRYRIYFSLGVEDKCWDIQQ